MISTKIRRTNWWLPEVGGLGCVGTKWVKMVKGMNFQFNCSSCPTLCDPRDCRTPGFPIHHQLLELTQTYVHQVGNAIQPCHPLSSPSISHLLSLPASGSFPMSQFFPSGGQSIEVSASVLPVIIQD